MTTNTAQYLYEDTTTRFTCAFQMQPQTVKLVTLQPEVYPTRKVVPL